MEFKNIQDLKSYAENDLVDFFDNHRYYSVTKDDVFSLMVSEEKNNYEHVYKVYMTTTLREDTIVAVYTYNLCNKFLETEYLGVISSSLTMLE